MRNSDCISRLSRMRLCEGGCLDDPEWPTNLESPVVDAPELETVFDGYRPR